MIAAAGAAYGYEMGFVFGLWGDYLIISVQMVAIVLQKLWYSKSRAHAAIISGVLCATPAAAYHYIPTTVLMALQTCSVPIISVSKGIQIVPNYRQNGTDQFLVDASQEPILS
uniref:Uncharacterized protein n=1 Tax=Ditylenchus dipsaci TaxID=166011 RepID=A0A915CUV9_9BILA